MKVIWNPLRKERIDGYEAPLENQQKQTKIFNLVQNRCYEYI